MRIDVPALSSADPYTYASQNLAPELMESSGKFAAAVYGASKLSLREFEGARVRTAEINGCMICQTFRAARDVPTMYAGLNRSVVGNGEAPSEDYYSAARQGSGSPLFSTRESLAIRFAEGFGTDPKGLAADEDFWTDMRANFSDSEIVDLAHCVAAWVGLGRVAHVLGFDEVCLAGPAAEAAV